MAIGATEHHMAGGVHRLDPLVTLIAADAFGIGLRLGLVDQVARRDRGRASDGSFGRDGGGRTVGGRRILRVGEGSDEDEKKKTSNVQRPTFNV